MHPCWLYYNIMRLYLRRKYVWMLDPKLDFINVFLWQSMILNSGFLARLRRTLSASENNHNNDVKALDCFMAYGGAVWQVEHTTMAWKRLPHFWIFMRGFHRTPVRFPHKRPIVRSFGVSFVCNVNKLLKKSRATGDFRRLNVHDGVIVGLTTLFSMILYIRRT